MVGLPVSQQKKGTSRKYCLLTVSQLVRSVGFSQCLCHPSSYIVTLILLPSLYLSSLSLLLPYILKYYTGQHPFCG